MSDLKNGNKFIGEVVFECCGEEQSYFFKFNQPLSFHNIRCSKCGIEAYRNPYNQSKICILERVEHGE